MASGDKKDSIEWWVMRLALLLLVLVSCSRPTSLPTRVFFRPIDVAVTCFDDAGNPIPLEGCSLDSQILAWVLDADRSGIGVVSIPDGTYMDAASFVPGFTPLTIRGSDGAPLPDLISVKSEPSSQAVYVLSRRGRAVVRIRPKGLEQTLQSLPCEPSAFDLVEGGAFGSALLLACPERAGIVVVPVDRFGEIESEALPLIPTTGRPHYLDASSDGSVVFITHEQVAAARRLGYLSRLELQTGREETLPLVPECSDGLDNDGDGLSDHLDPGCESAEDDIEANDSRRSCEDGLDNDGDALTDSGDPDCGPKGVSEYPLIPIPECSNGVDDDADGFADWPQDHDCYGPGFKKETSPAVRVVGAPVLSADNRYVYVPLSNPFAIAVFEAEPFARVNVNAMDGPSPNILFHRLGIKDIVLTSGVTALTMVKDQTGNRAIVGMASGQVLSIRVDSGGQPVHQQEVLEESSVASSASVPVLKVRNLRIGTLAEISSEYPSFGSNIVAPLDVSKNIYSYYGIVFGSNPYLHLSETWKVTYEGVLPGTESDSGFFEPKTSTLVDPTRDFCNLGVQPGDHLILRSLVADCAVVDAYQNKSCPKVPELHDDFPPGLINGCEYGIREVKADRLVLEELPGMRGLDMLSAIPSPVAYEIRASDSWVVVGSRSGFLHNKVSVGKECIERPDADIRFVGRAFTSKLKPGHSLPSCPVQPGAQELEWLSFTNLAFSFTIFPPCRQGETVAAEECRVIRNTEISFGVAQGLALKAAAIEGFPMGLTKVASFVIAVEPVFGALHLIDLETMRVWKTLY